MSDVGNVESEDSGGYGAPIGYPSSVWPFPELPENVAIAGSKIGRQYLCRPGELVARNRDLQRNGEELFRRLRDDYGAVELQVPPSRLQCRDYALTMLDRDPQAPAVQQACASIQTRPEGFQGTDQDLLRAILKTQATRLQDRERLRQDEARAMLARQDITMLKLPGLGRDVTKVLRKLRKEAGGKTAGIWANQVFVAAQDWGWVPAVPAVRLTRRSLPEAPGEGEAGQGVRVAVVDTGVRGRHGWLENACEFRAVDYEELDEDRDLKLDFEAGHGTFVAGMVRQLAPGATIIGRAVVDTRGFTDDVALAATLETLEDECVDIVNMSLGGLADPVKPAPSTRRALDMLRTANPRLTVVAAAGNRNRPDPYYPAALPGVIAVGALDQDLRRAVFSNYGPWVDAWALGVDVESSYVGVDVTATADTDPGGLDGARWSGTSFAAPRVAGGIAAAMRPAP